MVFLLSASQTQGNFKKLTPEEEQVIVHKGTEMPFTGKYYAFWEKGTTCVNAAAQNCTVQKTSLKPTAAGQASTTKFREPSFESQIRTECARKSNAPTAAPTSDTSSQASTSPKKIHGTVLIRCPWSLFLTKKSSQFFSLNKAFCDKANIEGYMSFKL